MRYANEQVMKEVPNNRLLHICTFKYQNHLHAHIDYSAAGEWLAFLEGGAREKHNKKCLR